MAGTGPISFSRPMKVSDALRLSDDGQFFDDYINEENPGIITTPGGAQYPNVAELDRRAAVRIDQLDRTGILNKITPYTTKAAFNSSLPNLQDGAYSVKADSSVQDSRGVSLPTQYNVVANAATLDRAALYQYVRGRWSVGWVSDVAASGFYKNGDIVVKSDASGYWQNLVDGNTSNPDVAGIGWIDSKDIGVNQPRTYKQKLQEDLPTAFDFIPTSEHNNILNGSPTMDVSSYLQQYIDATVDGQEVRFPRGRMIAYHVVRKGRRSYVGENRDSSTIAAPDGVTHDGVLISDRWWYSNVSLGRQESIKHLTIDGGKTRGASGPGLVLCNYRPLVDDVQIQNCVGSHILMPGALKNGTSVNSFNAVGAQLLNLRLENTDRYAIETQGGSTYSDFWYSNLSISGALRAMHLGIGSGGFISKVHADSIRGSGLVVETASTMAIWDWYQESYGTGLEGGAVASIIAIQAMRGLGFLIGNIRGRNQNGIPGVEYRLMTLAAAINEAASVNVMGCNYRMEDGRANLGFDLSASSGGSLDVTFTANNTRNFVRLLRNSGGSVSFNGDGGNNWNKGTALPTSQTVDGLASFWSKGLERKNTDVDAAIEKWTCTTAGSAGTWLPQYRHEIPAWARTIRVNGNAAISVPMGPYRLVSRGVATGRLIIGTVAKSAGSAPWPKRAYYEATVSVHAKDSADVVDVKVDNEVAPTGFSSPPVIAVTGTPDAWTLTVSFTLSASDGDGAVSWLFSTSTPQ
ncbi:hypothetical protein [Hydrocarboniphaga effusa]|uniref:hypothetical protein n=1 Tax=Hydrocarboniphaga effusa TaxID=243629 RepID=UPI00398BE7AE